MSSIFSKQPTKDVGEILIKDQRYFVIGQIVHAFGFFVHLSWILTFFLLDAYIMAYVNIASAAIFYLTYKMNKNKMFFLAIAIAVIEVTVHQVLAVIFLGPGTGFQFYLITILIVPFLITPSNKYKLPKVLLSILVIAIFIKLSVLFDQTIPFYTLKPYIVDIFIVFNAFSAMFVLVAIGFYFNKSVTDAEEELESERKKTESLLHNILPHSICEKLKTEQSTIADKFDDVSILFLDIVGFTELSSRKSPKEMVDILNEIFTDFDCLGEVYKLEKIKTIGDSYMIAAGVPKNDPEGAENIIKFASKLNDIVDDFNQRSNENLQIRIGINTGTVVAGIIGRYKFAYDVWGDAVNIASRMESHGVVGKVHVSESTYLAVKNLFEFEKLAPIEIKGKGMMQTYLLV